MTKQLHQRSYAMIGTGAIGGYYGACLQQAGFGVHFLLRSDYETVRKRGLIIKSVKGDFALPQVNAYRDTKEMPACDVVVVALKTTQNHLLAQILPQVLHENSIILVLQNGLGSEVDIAEMVGDIPIMGGLCFICSNKVGAGEVHHLDYGKITLAEYSKGYTACGMTPRLKELATDFQSAGIAIELSEDLLLTRWQKLVWNIPYNGLSVVLNAMTNEMMAQSEIRQLIEAIMTEVTLGAKSRNRLITDSFIQSRLQHTETMKPYRTSMKIDYDCQRPLELEAIFARPLEMATSAGIELPRITMLYQQLRFLQARYQ
jgi:2-dehydropantoate 2-reductase